MDATGLQFDDERWSRLFGGYRVPYDPRKALLALESGQGVREAWLELWNELHHQGDIGDASYAAIPHIVRIYRQNNIPNDNTYAIAVIIELARDNSRNPQMPEYLRRAYDLAWQDLFEIGLSELKAAQNQSLVTFILAMLAVAKGQRSLGHLASFLTENERFELIINSGGF